MVINGSQVNSTCKESKRNLSRGVFWENISSNLWLPERDNNSKYFHVVTKQRRTRNKILGLENNIEEVAIRYYGDIFSTSQP